MEAEEMFKHQLWNTMNNLEFIKGYLEDYLENSIEEDKLPVKFWEILDGCILDIREHMEYDIDMTKEKNI